MRLLRPTHIFARVLCTALMLLHLSVYSTAQAQVPTVPTSGGGGGMVGYVFDMVAGNRNITRNNLGATIINLPPGETSDEIHALFKGDGLIWARWYRLAAVGSVQVVKSVWTPQLNEAGGHMQLHIINYDPETASKKYTDYQQSSPIKNYYNGVDPFEPFKGGNGMWNKVGRNELYTAVGQASMRYGVSKAYVAVALQRDAMRTWDKCLVKVLGACLKKRFFQELSTYVKPTWSIGTAVERARGRTYTTAFRVAGCTLTAESCLVNSGMAFIDASTHSDFPQAEELVSVIEHHNDAWTGLAFALLFATLAVIAAPLLLDAPGLLASVINAGAVGTVESAFAAYAIDALGYAVVSLAMNGGGSITDIQDGFFGNMDAVPVAGSFTATEVDSEWDMRPKVIENWVTKPIAQMDGSVGEMMTAHPVGMNEKPVNDFWNQRQQPPMREGGYPITQ